MISRTFGSLLQFVTSFFLPPSVFVVLFILTHDSLPATTVAEQMGVLQQGVIAVKLLGLNRLIHIIHNIDNRPVPLLASY